MDYIIKILKVYFNFKYFVVLTFVLLSIKNHNVSVRDIIAGASLDPSRLVLSKNLISIRNPYYKAIMGIYLQSHAPALLALQLSFLTLLIH